jgi:hypothetical protein
MRRRNDLLSLWHSQPTPSASLARARLMHLLDAAALSQSRISEQRLSRLPDGVAATLCVPRPQLPDMLGRRQHETTRFSGSLALRQARQAAAYGLFKPGYRVHGLLERSTAAKEMLPMYRNRNRRNELAPCRPFFHSPPRDDQRGRIFISPRCYKRAGSVVLSGAGRSILLKAAHDYRIPPTLRALGVSERKPNRITIGPR